jgi:polyvinyl alcohol dehydrogenase (cytochrome)
MIRSYLLIAALLALSACGNEAEAPELATATTNSASTPSETELDWDSSAQVQLEELRQKQAMPGRAHYDAVCAACHEGAVKKAPHREMIGLMNPEAILRTITTGIMVEEASSLTDAQRIEVAEYLAGAKMGDTSLAAIPQCGDDVALDLSKPPHMTNWGLEPNNSRNIPAAVAGIGPSDIAKLKPKWALQFPGANRARSQPTLAGGLIFVGSHNAHVYALDQETGCQVWAFETSGEVRTGIVIDAWDSDVAKPAIYFGDVLGFVYALDAATGTEIWRQRADEHPNATITGTPSLHDGKLLASVSSLEVSLAVDPTYECCTSRGSVVAYDLQSGEQVWKTYTVDEPARVQSQNSVGTNMMGPSGATVWNSPSIDAKRNQLYIGTGENMSSPATLTSDAIFAIDIATGKVNWVFQATANDVWNTACDTDSPQSCPPEGGPDFDFGCATLLAQLSDGTELVVGGQKSGFVHALDPDTGKLMWQTRVGRGGIQGGVHFGMATAGDRLYVGISDMADGRTYDEPSTPGLRAVNLKTGELEWYAAAPEDVCKDRVFCHPGISQAVTSVNGMVFAGGMDGVMRVHNGADGALLMELDSTNEFATVNGQPTRGGSFGGGAGPIVQDGLVVLSSGYGLYNHMPGNLLLVMEAGE